MHEALYKDLVHDVVRSVSNLVVLREDDTTR